MSAARRKSVNATVLDILEGAAGVSGRREWLNRFMTWSSEDVRAMDEAVSAQRVVDQKLWR